MLIGVLTFIGALSLIAFILLLFRVGFWLSDKFDNSGAGFMAYMLWMTGWLIALPAAILVGLFA